MNYRFQSTRLPLLIFALTVALLTAVCFNDGVAQTLTSYDRDAGREMLKMIKLDLQKHYYDPGFHGIDLDERFQQADERIKKAKSNSEIFGIIAQALLDFEDSHLIFIPPPRASKVEYGWQMQAIGDDCFVVAVKPGSDAEAKGLKPGDLIKSIDGFEAHRGVAWKMQYFYYVLRPKPGMRLVVQSPGAQPRQLEVIAKIQPGKKVIDLTRGSAIPWLLSDAENEARLERNRFAEKDDLIIWKMAGFNIYDEQEVDAMMDRVKKHQSLILDLRGNGGGYVIMLKRLLANFFDRDVKVGDLKYRKEVKAEFAKTRGKDNFKGKVVVLIDSGSGSAAELFARIMQLEKRGVVLGDRSAGAVMQSVQFSHDLGLETITFYGASVTNADILMTDGRSLEHTGVTPDELILPTAVDLAAQRDPVMTRAAELVGFKLDPATAGTLFPLEWRK